MLPKLPKEINIKIESPTEIKLFADGVEFPFDISLLKISYSPEDGFYYGISAGYGQSQPVEVIVEKQEIYRKAGNAVLPNNNNIMTPSKLGVVPMDEEDDSGFNVTTMEKKNLGAKATEVLNTLYPERSKHIVANVPRGMEDFGFKRMDTESKNIETDDDIRELLVELSNMEEEVFSADKESGINRKYMCVQLPTLMWEEDKSAYVEERFRIYE